VTKYLIVVTVVKDLKEKQVALVALKKIALPTLTRLLLQLNKF
jgi:hypothetical protein